MTQLYISANPWPFWAYRNVQKKKKKNKKKKKKKSKIMRGQQSRLRVSTSPLSALWA